VLRCRDIRVRTKFHKDWFRRSNVNRVDTQTENKESRLKIDFTKEWCGTEKNPVPPEDCLVPTTEYLKNILK
jgi:hypothetical protein